MGNARSHLKLAAFRSDPVGFGIGAEIAEARIQKVFDLLRKPSQTIDSIADLAGYATCGALRKAFRLRTGVSMREWRQREFAQK